MSKPPSVQLEWTDSRREIERAREKKRKPQRIARIRIRCPLADRDQPYRFQRSLGLTSETEAKRVQATIADTLARLDRGNGVELPPNLTPDLFFEFLKTGGKEKRKTKLATKTLSEVIDDYFEHLPEDAKAAGSLYTERIHHKHLISLLGRQAVFADIGYRELSRYAKQRKSKSKVKGVTIAKELTTFNVLWDHAVKSGFCEGDSPAKGVAIPQDEDRRPFSALSEVEQMVRTGNLSDEEIEQRWESVFLEARDIFELLDVVRSSEHVKRFPFVFPMFALPAYTGCRRGEIMRSLKIDFNFDRELVLIRETKRKKTKAGSMRRVDMHNRLALIMQSWFEKHPGGPYAICSNDKRPLTRSASIYHWKTPLKGTRFEKLPGFHCLRHSLISIAPMKGVPQAVIDSWAGHTTNVRERYIHLLPRAGKQAMNSILVSDLLPSAGQSV